MQNKNASQKEAMVGKYKEQAVFLEQKMFKFFVW